jgi:hypothetical protein
MRSTRRVIAHISITSTDKRALATLTDIASGSNDGCCRLRYGDPRKSGLRRA